VPKLYAPQGYWKLSLEAKRNLCNGCGTRGVVGILIPDTLYGLRITEACFIHDYMYVVGTNHADKKEADRVFLYNMLRITHARTSSRILTWLRRRRAREYYLAVKTFGGPAFWAGKNSEMTYRDPLEIDI
jgi:hypothetical protein